VLSSQRPMFRHFDCGFAALRLCSFASLR